MTEGIILGVAVAAGLACPVHMWWSHKRGRQAACCPPSREADREDEIDVLRARQERLSVLIAEHDPTVAGAAAAEEVHGPVRNW